MIEDSDKTQIFNYGSSAPKKNEDKDETKIREEDETVFQHETSRTTDQGDHTVILGDSQSGQEVEQTKRKLVGWLVSYTLDAAGTDFRLFEGKNKLGRHQTNDIRVFQDSKISGLHAVILYRGDNFYVKDEMASNASFHNDEEIKPGETVSVKDGDTLKFGDSTFIIRKACV